MQDGGLFMMSPMDANGEERLRRVRACIKQTFGPGGPGRRPKRTLAMPAAIPTPVKTPRTKLRQRIQQAAQLSTEELFFQEFGSCEELLSEEFDLVRPAGHPKPAASRPVDATSQSALYPAASSLSTRQPVAPISHFSFGAPALSSSAAASAFTSSLPAPSTTNVGQLTRPSRVRTPRKTAVKRARAGESSAEKALPLRKPRLGGFSARSIDYSSAVGTSSFGAAAASTADPRRSLAFVTTKRGDQVVGPPSYSSRFLSRTSPSKFQFSSSATRLFSQRQAPLR